MKNQTDLSSRISVRAVAAGSMVALSFMFLSLSLIAALGIWNYNLNELSNVGTSFWISTTIAWSISLYLGGFVASLSTRPQNTTEGALNAIAACCASYLLFGTGFLFFAPTALESLLMSATPQFFLRAFLGDALAFIVGVYGGVVGVHFENRSPEGAKSQQRRGVHYST